MKIQVKQIVEKDAKYLVVRAGVRYWEDATINGIPDENGDLTPCREGSNWRPKIDIDSGRILNWKEGVIGDIHFKVCDDGDYRILDEDGDEIVKKEGYVPDIMCPEENGYGDYIIMKINENGFIAHWQPDLTDFQNEDD